MSSPPLALLGRLFKKSPATSDAPYTDAGIKASEKFLEHLRAENDRVVQEIRVAEDRGCGNATLAAAAIPIIAFLKPSGFGPWETALSIGALVGVILTLAIVLGIVRNRTTHRTEDSWYPATQEDIYREQRQYDRFLYELQSIWLQHFIDNKKVRDAKYRLLTSQTWTVGIVVLSLSLLLISLAL